MLCVYDGESRSSVYTSILGLKSVYNFKSKALKTIDSQAKWNTKNVAEDTCYKTQRVSSLFVVIFFSSSPLLSGCQNGLLYVWTVPQGGSSVSVPHFLSASSSQDRSGVVKVRACFSCFCSCASGINFTFTTLYLYIYLLYFIWMEDWAFCSHCWCVFFFVQKHTHTHQFLSLNEHT